jgi:D-alanyl-D-alanine carboxypeptidase
MSGRTPAKVTRLALIGAVMAVTNLGCGAAVSPTAIATGPTPAASRTEAPSASASPSSGLPSDPHATPAAPIVIPVTMLGDLPPGALDAATAARLQRVLDDRVRYGAPDAIAAVITSGGTWAGAAGVDGAKGRAAKPGDEFAIASVSKLLLGTLVMRLVARGAMDLDAPLASYLGTMAVDANGATVRQALAMESGLGDTITSALDSSLAHCGHAFSTDEVLASIPKPYASPGTDYHYSNPTYKLLGYAVERASGRPLAEALRTEILDPVGADRILLQGPTSHPPKPWALPIEGQTGSLDVGLFGTGGTLPCLGFSSLALGASGMAADAPSLARWGWQLFAGRMVDGASLSAMTTFGLGVDRFDEYRPDVIYGHTGSLPGYAAVLAILPKRQIVIAMFVNDEQHDVPADLRPLLAAIGD